MYLMSRVDSAAISVPRSVVPLWYWLRSDMSKHVDCMVDWIFSSPILDSRYVIYYHLSLSVVKSCTRMSLKRRPKICLSICLTWLRGMVARIKYLFGSCTSVISVTVNFAVLERKDSFVTSMYFFVSFSSAACPLPQIPIDDLFLRSRKDASVSVILAGSCTYHDWLCCMLPGFEQGKKLLLLLHRQFPRLTWCAPPPHTTA